MRAIRIIVLSCIISVLGATSANAGMFENVVEGLRFAGFAVDGNHDGISNSTVGVIGTNFRGNVVDVGDFNFSLTGPVSAVVQRGGRGIPTYEVILSTGPLSINPNQVTSVGPAQPLAYNLSFDSGLNTTDITGNLLADMRFSINRFGSYDLRLQFSDRQTTTIDGAFDETSPLDFNTDLGPIDIEGNIIADVLAVVTDPFFKAAGLENLFANISGLTILEESLQASTGTLTSKVGLSLFSSILGLDPGSLGIVPDGLTADASNPVIVSAIAVPEPAVLVLMGLGALTLLPRRASFIND